MNLNSRPGWTTDPDVILESSVLSLEVLIYEGESQDSLLRRFQRMVQTSGILREAKSRSRFVSKRDAARIKAKNSARRRRKQRQSTY